MSTAVDKDMGRVTTPVFHDLHVDRFDGGRQAKHNEIDRAADEHVDGRQNLRQ